MPAYGYPDWQKSKTSFAYPLVDDSSVISMTGKNYGTFYVGNWPNLFIGFNNHDALAVDTITLTWFDANNAIVGTGREVIVFGSGDNSGLSIPCKAPFVQVVITANVNATMSTQTLVYGTDANRTPLNSDGTNYHMFFFGPSFTSNQSQGPFGMNFWYTGWAQISTSSSLAASAFIELAYVNPSNTSTIFARIGVNGQSMGDMEMVYIPPNPITCRVQNGSTAQTILTIIAPAPR